MKFGDSVIYVRSGTELNALVVGARGDELELAYFDPAIGEVLYRTHGTTSRAFSVPPLKEGSQNGWRESAINSVADIDVLTKPFVDKIKELEAKREELGVEIESLVADKIAALDQVYRLSRGLEPTSILPVAGMVEQESESALPSAATA